MFNRNKNQSLLKNLNDVLNKAKMEKYAVPQFNINNLEWEKYILEECELLKAPVIIGVSESSVKYMGGYNTVVKCTEGLIKDLNLTIPVVLHLDHSTSVEECKKAIDAGFKSVMIDASKYALTDNIRMTKEVVEYAKKKAVTVEAEIGRIESEGSTNQLPANVEECVNMAVLAKVDAIAPALGSKHGFYASEVNIDFTKMIDIGLKTNLPLVLHGGSGIPNDKVLQAIECGTYKINFNTELQYNWKKHVNDFLQFNPNEIDPRKIIGAGEKGIKAVVRTKVTLLKDDNKA